MQKELPKTYPYKVRIYAERVYTIDAESKSEAQETAWLNFLKEHALSDRDSTAKLFRVEEYKEPTNWTQTAEDEGKEIANEAEDDLKELVDTYVKENLTGKTPEELEAVDTDEIVNELYDKYNDEHDVRDQAFSAGDGYFIYRSTDAVIEMLNCLDELSEYEETDSGLWEGEDDIGSIAAAKATYTLINAITDNAEGAIKDKLRELIEGTAI